MDYTPEQIKQAARYVMAFSLGSMATSLLCMSVLAASDKRFNKLLTRAKLNHEVLMALADRTDEATLQEVIDEHQFNFIIQDAL